MCKSGTGAEAYTPWGGAVYSGSAQGLSPEPRGGALHVLRRARGQVAGVRFSPVTGTGAPSWAPLASAWGRWGEVSPGGGASCRCQGRPELGDHPLPAACSWGRQQSGSAAHLLWARACECGNPALSLWPACPAGCRAPRGWRNVAPRGYLSPL